MKNLNDPSLFSRLLGTCFETLPDPVRNLHAAADGTVFRGTASVRRGGVLASLIGRFVGLPATRERAPLTVTIRKSDTGEVWWRDFSGETMVSTLSERNSHLSERLGPVRFGFELRVRDGAINWAVRNVALIGIPLPTGWFTGVSAREYAVDERYHFDVRASLPLIGRLIEYRGELYVASNETNRASCSQPSS